MAKRFSIYIGIALVLIAVGILQLFVMQLKIGDEKAFSGSKLMEQAIFQGTSNYPVVAAYPSLGSNDASINVIAYFDPMFSHKVFFDELYDEFQSQYLDSGKAQLLVKTPVSRSDILEKNIRYDVAGYFFCFEKLSRDSAAEMMLQYVEKKDVEAVLAAFEVDSGEFYSCVDSVSFEDLYVSVLETDSLGIEGINARFYIGITNNYDTLEGIPTYTRLQKSIRNFEITLGI